MTQETIKIKEKTVEVNVQTHPRTMAEDVGLLPDAGYFDDEKYEFPEKELVMSSATDADF